jgi:threonine dehydratase
MFAPLPRGSRAVVRTAMDYSRTLSQITGADIWLKFENLQFTAAYKERGALNAMLHLNEEQRNRGVIAASAGNHAQGLAYHGTRLGIPVTIVMPRTTPTVKVMQTEVLGGKVVLHGESFDEAYAHARQLEGRTGADIHPPVRRSARRRRAGHGRAGNAGAGARTRHAGDPGRRRRAGILGHGYGGPRDQAGHRPDRGGGAAVPLDVQPAEGQRAALRRRYPGRRHRGEGTGRVHLAGAGHDMLDDLLLVSEAQMENAVSLLLQIEKTVVEGAGAAGLAAVMAHPERFKGRKIGIPLTGGNIDTRLLANVLLRDLARSGRLARLRLTLAGPPRRAVTR